MVGLSAVRAMSCCVLRRVAFPLVFENIVARDGELSPDVRPLRMDPNGLG